MSDRTLFILRAATGPAFLAVAILGGCTEKVVSARGLGASSQQAQQPIERKSSYKAPPKQKDRERIKATNWEARTSTK